MWWLLLSIIFPRTTSEHKGAQTLVYHLRLMLLVVDKSLVFISGTLWLREQSEKAWLVLSFIFALVDVLFGGIVDNE